MKELTHQFPVVKGRFLDKEKFIHEHPELKGTLGHLPDEGYFEYDEKTNKITYHLDLGLSITMDYSDSHHIPTAVVNSLQEVGKIIDTTIRMLRGEE